MLDGVIIIACFWLVVENVRFLAQVPFSQWETAHFATAAVSVVLAALGVHRVIKVFRDNKKRKAEKAAMQAKTTVEYEEDEAPEDEPETPTAKTEDDDLAWLDEMDAEEDAKKQ